MPLRSGGNLIPPDTQAKRLTCTGTPTLDRVSYKVAGRRRYEHALVITDGDNITITDLQGELLIEHKRAAPGVTYVGNGRTLNPDFDEPEMSPKS